MEARTSLDAIRHILAAPHHGTGVGTLRHWANAQRRLMDAQVGVDGPDSFIPNPWSATVALSLDAPSGPGAPDMAGDWLANDAEQVASFLLACGFRVAHAGDLRPGGISERLFRLASQYGRRVSTEALQSHAAAAPSGQFGVTGYCAWPIHIRMPTEELETYVIDCGGSDNLNFLTLDGESRPYTYFSDAVRHDPAPRRMDQRDVRIAKHDGPGQFRPSCDWRRNGDRPRTHAGLGARRAVVPPKPAPPYTSSPVLVAVQGTSRLLSN